MAAPKGTVAIEEAVLNPEGIEWHSKSAIFYMPGASEKDVKEHGLTKALLDIHGERLARMDATGVEYMLLSLTSVSVQGEPDKAKAASMAVNANDWLAGEVAKNPARFGGLASIAMHDANDAAAELRRSVRELGMFGAIINDFQEVYDDESKTVKRVWYDTPDYHPFWAAVEELGVPVYLHPRYPVEKEVGPGEMYGPGKRHLLGAAVSFHLSLSYHIYALMSSGIFDLYPKAQIVIGHLGEGIPFNLWRADHWYNKPVKRKGRPSKEDYTFYMTHNVSVTTSGNYSTKALKYCIDVLGEERCMYSIDYPYDTIDEAQEWWHGLDLPAKQKELVGRENAIRLFKLPLEL
ncbi:hypothetical protein GE09DRAFT_1231293 [Coniochaeta sp. 2T2.1]|nr:hypothetical protein GE09DRAFT_1231293 [Coniochaeta sp. 2T2.1]